MTKLNPADVSEREIERHLADCVKMRGGISFKFISPGAIGVPDRIVLLRGKIAFVELKTMTGRVSPMQKYQHQRIEEHGFPVYVLRSFEEVDDLLRRWDETKQSRSP